MSESLDWEKWSAFTHNRHLEEVEKYSKPGSVAEKKAYFEAHFKRRRAAALLEQQNAAANDISETNTEIKVEDINSSSDLDLAQRDSYAVVENTKGEVQNSDPLLPVGQSDSCDASNERMSEDAQPGEIEKVTEQPYLMENPVELTKHLENDERVGDIASKKEDKDDSAKRNSASLSEKKSEVSSSKLSTTSKCATFVKPIMPIQLKNSIKTPDSKKNAMDSSNKRRSYTTSLHMSINFDSCSGETRKATSPGLPKTANPRLASVNGKYKHHSATPPAENRRTITPQGDSKSGSRTVDWKAKHDYRSASSSFTFKSEERAAKRKEFFQKLEQKSKSKETEKHELHAKSQVKARSSFNDLRNSLCRKQQQMQRFLPEQNYQIPTVRPSFPKIEERASFKVHGNDSRPPWRLSVKTEGLKDVTEKNSRLSAKCFSRKAMKTLLRISRFKVLVLCILYLCGEKVLERWKCYS
ncbi:hypothetical protein DH2020_027091 [Rehmannia glutinosa]|uniref:TPX2 C-terminal domain-containing protein n=1 Tax=Rehmannia glutinosa TaxID=99300 RepID=A0ABR0VY09_REHGL